MLLYVETRRAGGQRRVSEVVLADASTDTAAPLEIQSAWLAARYNVGAAHARVLAELVFAKGSLR